MEIKKVENEINKKIAKNYDKKAGKSIKRVHFSGVDSIVEDSNKKFSSSLGPPLRADATQSDMSIESTTSTKKEKRTLNIIPLYRDTSPAPGISTTRPKSASYSAPAEDKALKASEDGRKELDLKLGLSKMVKETEKKERRFLEEISEKLTNFSPNNKETEKPPEKSASGEKTPTCDLNHPGTDNKAPEGHSEPKKRRFALSHPLAQLRGVRSPNIRCKTLSDGRTVFMFLISGTSYLVKKQIGRGGWSNVYKVVSQKTRKKYAVKHILIKDPSITANFVREIEILRQLQGEKSIICLIDYERDNENSQLFMVFELAESDVAEFLRVSAPLSIFSARYFWGQMVDAVRVLHEARVVHKDLKPQNFVLVNSSVKLIDFGLANTVSEMTTHIYNEKTVFMLKIVKINVLR